MPLDIETTGEGITVADGTAFGNVEKSLILIDVYYDSLESVESSDNAGYLMRQSSSDLLGWSVVVNPVDGFVFRRGWSGALGTWSSDTDLVSAGNQYMLGVYYDASSSDNDARLYVNGTYDSDYVNDTAPSGALNNVSSDSLTIGTGVTGGSAYTLNGQLERVRYYDLTTAAFSDAKIDSIVSNIYNGKSLRDGEITPTFALDLIGCSGVQKYDGTTLSSDNQFTDWAGGLRGEVTGTPVGRGLTHLSVGK